jgi:hypothetical protein
MEQLNSWPKQYMNNQFLSTTNNYEKTKLYNAHWLFFTLFMYSTEYSDIDNTYDSDMMIT